VQAVLFAQAVASKALGFTRALIPMILGLLANVSVRSAADEPVFESSAP